MREVNYSELSCKLTDYLSDNGDVMIDGILRLVKESSYEPSEQIKAEKSSNLLRQVDTYLKSVPIEGIDFMSDDGHLLNACKDEIINSYDEIELLRVKNLTQKGLIENLMGKVDELESTTEGYRYRGVENRLRSQLVSEKERRISAEKGLACLDMCSQKFYGESQCHTCEHISSYPI